MFLTLIQFDPESLPSVQYMMRDPTVTLMVFAKGKVNLFGGASEKAINQAMEKLYTLLCINEWTAVWLGD